MGAEPMLKKVARLVFAHSGPICASERLAFQMLDFRGYGELSLGVLEDDFRKKGSHIPEDLEELFSAVDLNRDGYIHQQAFLSAVMPAETLNDKQLCRFAFDALDTTKSGAISPADLEAFFSHSSGSSACSGAIQEVCGENSMTFDQFVRMMYTEEQVSPPTRRHDTVRQFKVRYLEQEGSSELACLNLSVPSHIRGKEFRKYLLELLHTMSSTVGKTEMMVHEGDVRREVSEDEFMPSDVYFNCPPPNHRNSSKNQSSPESQKESSP